MTQVSWKRQLGLAIALFALGSFAYWLEYNHRPKKEAAEELNKKIFPLKDVTVESIGLVNGDKTVSFTCLDAAAKQCKPGDNSKWQMDKPLKTRADDSNVNGLVSALNNLESPETIDLKDETPEKRAALLKEYGLDPASRQAAGPDKRRVEVKTAGGGGETLYLGLTHPIGEGIFAVKQPLGAGNPPVDETKVYLVPNPFKANLEHDLTYWRDKKLITLASHEIGSFDLTGTRAVVSGERKDGQWFIQGQGGPAGKKTTTEAFAGDTENVDALLNGATYLIAKGFAANRKDDPSAQAVLKGAKKIIVLTMMKEKKSGAQASPSPDSRASDAVILTLFQKNSPASSGKDKPSIVAPKIYATVSNLDPLFELEPYAKERLDKELKDLRLAKLITSMERFNAKRLVFSGPTLNGAPLALTNKDGKWVLEADAKAELDSEKVQTLLDKLSGTRIKDFLAASALPKGESDGGLKMIFGDDKSTNKREYIFWRSGGKLYARDLLSQKMEGFLMDNGVSDALPWARDFFNKKGTPPQPVPSPSPKADPMALPPGHPPISK